MILTVSKAVKMHWNRSLQRSLKRQHHPSFSRIDIQLIIVQTEWIYGTDFVARVAAALFVFVPKRE